MTMRPDLPYFLGLAADKAEVPTTYIDLKAAVLVECNHNEIDWVKVSGLPTPALSGVLKEDVDAALQFFARACHIGIEMVTSSDGKQLPNVRTAIRFALYRTESDLVALRTTNPELLSSTTARAR